MSYDDKNNSLGLFFFSLWICVQASISFHFYLAQSDLGLLNSVILAYQDQLCIV